MSEARVRLLAATLGRLALHEAGNSLGGDPPLRRKRRAHAVREAFERLRPLYTKVGQVLSTRPGFVSAETTAELGKLHDRVPVSAFSDFAPVPADELGPNWHRNFRHIDTEHPLGSASLAQVYRVTPADGREAAMKVQRPGIRSIIHTDMAVPRRAARILVAVKPNFNTVVDVHAILDMIFEAVEGELDFTAEARNMELGRRWTEVFDHLTVPEVIRVTCRVLVQGMAPGRSIRDVAQSEFSEG